MPSSDPKANHDAVPPPDGLRKKGFISSLRSIIPLRPRAGRREDVQETKILDASDSSAAVAPPSPISQQTPPDPDQFSPGTGRSTAVSDHQQLLYALLIDISLIEGAFIKALALYNPATKHNWVSKAFAEKHLQKTTYDKLSPYHNDAESKVAIGQLDLYWACYALSRHRQHGAFLVAPHADFQVLLGTEAESAPQRVLGKGIKEGTLKEEIERTVAVDGQIVPEADSSIGIDFEKGIQDGTLLQVLGIEKTSGLPSIADVQNYLNNRSHITKSLPTDSGPNSGSRRASYVEHVLSERKVASSPGSREPSPWGKRDLERSDSTNKRRRSALYDANPVLPSEDNLLDHPDGEQSMQSSFVHPNDGPEQSRALSKSPAMSGPSTLPTPDLDHSGPGAFRTQGIISEVLNKSPERRLDAASSVTTRISHRRPSRSKAGNIHRMGKSMDSLGVPVRRAGEDTWVGQNPAYSDKLLLLGQPWSDIARARSPESSFLESSSISKYKTSALPTESRRYSLPDSTSPTAYRSEFLFQQPWLPPSEITEHLEEEDDSNRFMPDSPRPEEGPSMHSMHARHESLPSSPRVP